MEKKATTRRINKKHSVLLILLILAFVGVIVAGCIMNYVHAAANNKEAAAVSQKVEEAQEKNKELEGFLKEKTAEGIFTPEEAEILHPEDFASFFRSGLYGRMKTAALSGKLHRESPFRMTVPAREVDPAWDTDEPVMIQGIIDAWFEEDGEIVLADYKTDRGISPEELGDRYRIQLDYYVRALEAIEDLPVKERMLWSFALGREIKA